MSTSDFDNQENISEEDGSLKKSGEENKLMSSSFSEDNKDGQIAEDMINNSIGSFVPDIVFQNLVQNFKNAKKLYGETIIRELTDFEPGYIDKNRNIPEFQREMKKNISANIDRLKNEGVLNSQYILTEQGYDSALINLCQEELDKLKIKGFGNKKVDKFDIYGEKEDYINFNNSINYRDISVSKTVKNAIQRKHKNIMISDITAFKRKKKGKIDVVYCLDASGSMKGNKLKLIKRAGVALSYKAIHDKNRVALLVFDSEIRKKIPLTQDFYFLLNELVRVRARNQTNICQVIDNAVELLAKSKNTKHIIILSDAMSNIGELKQVYESASIAKSQQISISFIGVNLDEKGIKVAKKIVDIGRGRFYKLSKLDNVDSILLEDYDFAMKN